MFTPEQLIGPAAGLVLALVAVAALWKEDRKSRQRDRDLIDKLTALIEQFPEAVRAQTEVIKDWADRIDIEQSNRRDRRASDR